MKRSTGLTRHTPLRRGTTPLKQSPLKARSRKMQRAYGGKDGRRAFVAWFLGVYPACMIRWENCQGAAVDVHEVIARGLGGSILPDDLAERQGQHFASTCRTCHGEVSTDTARGRREGWVASLPVAGHRPCERRGVAAYLIRARFEEESR